MVKISRSVLVKINRSVYSKQETYLIETRELRTESGTLVRSNIYVFEDVTLCNKKGFRLFEGHFLS